MEHENIVEFGRFSSIVANVVRQQHLCLQIELFITNEMIIVPLLTSVLGVRARCVVCFACGFFAFHS